MLIAPKQDTTNIKLISTAFILAPFFDKRLYFIPKIIEHIFAHVYLKIHNLKILDQYKFNKN